MSMKTLADAFHDELRDALSAEKQLVKALPKMIKAANCDRLRSALQDHLAETENHVQRVEQSFQETGKSARAKTCEAMKGLLVEAESMLQEEAEPAVKDAIIIACAQKVEHYEIATYGTLCTWAEMLDYPNALSLLKQNINEEEIADRNLSKLAMAINRDALSVG